MPQPTRPARRRGNRITRHLTHAAAAGIAAALVLTGCTKDTDDHRSQAPTTVDDGHGPDVSRARTVGELTSTLAKYKGPWQVSSTYAEGGGPYVTGDDGTVRYHSQDMADLGVEQRYYDAGTQRCYEQNGETWGYTSGELVAMTEPDPLVSLANTIELGLRAPRDTKLTREGRTLTATTTVRQPGVPEGYGEEDVTATVHLGAHGEATKITTTSHSTSGGKHVGGPYTQTDTISYDPKYTVPEGAANIEPEVGTDVSPDEGVSTAAGQCLAAFAHPLSDAPATDEAQNAAIAFAGALQGEDTTHIPTKTELDELAAKVPGYRFDAPVTGEYGTEVGLTVEKTGAQACMVFTGDENGSTYLAGPCPSAGGGTPAAPGAGD